MQDELRSRLRSPIAVGGFWNSDASGGWGGSLNDPNLLTIDHYVHLPQ